MHALDVVRRPDAVIRFERSPLETREALRSRFATTVAIASALALSVPTESVAAQDARPSQSTNPLCALVGDDYAAAVQQEWALEPRGWWCAVWWTVDGRRITAGLEVANDGGESVDTVKIRKDAEITLFDRDLHATPAPHLGMGPGTAYERFGQTCPGCYIASFKVGCVYANLQDKAGDGRTIAILVDRAIKAHPTRGCNMTRLSSPGGGSTGGGTGGSGTSGGTSDGSTTSDGVPPPTVIGGNSNPPPIDDLPDDSGEGSIPWGPLLIGAGLIGTVLIGRGIQRINARPSAGSPAATQTSAGKKIEPVDFRPEPPALPEELPPLDEEPAAYLPTPPDTLPEPILPPADQDPIAKLKKAAKKAAKEAKPSMKEAKPAEEKKPLIEEIETPELANLKKEREDWEKTRKSGEKKTPQKPEPAKPDDSELEKLKADAKRAEEEAAAKAMKEIDDMLREQEEEEKRAQEAEARAKAEKIKQDLIEAEIEKERQKKEAEAAAAEAERAAAEEAELKRKREERERERREQDAREEAEEKAREAAEAEAARQAAEAKKQEESEAEKSRRVEKEIDDFYDEMDEGKQAGKEIDDWYREEAIEKAREANEKEWKRLTELGFEPRDIWEYKRNLGEMEAGTYTRSSERMGRAEFVAEMGSYASDKSIDYLAGLTGAPGSKVKEAYVASKYFLGSAAGDLLPGGEGVTAERIKKGATDAVIEVGVSRVWDKVIDSSGAKWADTKGYNISDAKTYWPDAYGAGRYIANNIRATGYVEAFKGLVEGTVWDTITVDRWKNMLKGDDITSPANAGEKYILRFPEK